MARRILSICFVLIAIFVLFVSCDVEIKEESNESVLIPTSEATTMEQEGINAAFTFGTVNRIFDKSGQISDVNQTARFFSGQHIVRNNIRLVFNAILVEYNSLTKYIADYVNSIGAANALMHQHYNGVVYDPTKTYVEFATYYYEGTIIPAFREVRVFDGNFLETFNKEYWYAKSVTFSPDFSIDISKNISLLTGQPKTYNWVAVGAALGAMDNAIKTEEGYSVFNYYDSGKVESETVYDSDYKRVKTIIYLYSDDVYRGKRVIEYGSNGRTSNTTNYDVNDKKTSEYKYEYDNNGNKIKQVIFRYSNGTFTGKTINEYGSDGTISKSFSYDANDNMTRESDYIYDEEGILKQKITKKYSDGVYTGKTICNYDSEGKDSEYIEYDVNENKIAYTELFYDEEGKLTQEILKRYSDGELTGKRIRDYDSKGEVSKYTEYDANENKTYESVTIYDESGKRIREEDQYYSNGVVSGYGIFEYDSDENPVRYSEKDTNDNTTAVTEYCGDGSWNVRTQTRFWYSDGVYIGKSVGDYDSDGNCISWTDYDANDNII